MRIPPFLLVAAFALLSTLPAPAALVGGVGYRDHMRNARYGEIIVVTGGPFCFQGQVYNTLGLNDCPEAAWQALDKDKIKHDFHGHAVILNGPRYFMMDQISLQHPGGVANFGPLEARHLATVNISLLMLFHGKAKPYTETTVNRTTTYVYKKGRPVYELISPQGVVYVMQTYALIVDPNLTEAQLAGLGSKLKLPAGWRYRRIAPTQDLVLKTSGKAYVLQDDLENSYQRTALQP